ncbi:MAG: M35 family metallopeptidase, partial [Gammaproteobacteria bacterium]|nr:M35 family metallopeptidase [Gammaproteobacteria bacterium]
THSVQLDQERIALQTQKADLEYTITQERHANVVIVAKASNVKEIGWALVPWNVVDYPWTAEVPSVNKVPPLKPSQISRVNEAIRRAKRASFGAMNVMIKLEKKTTFSTPPTSEEQIYLDYFGAHDRSRIRRVRDNFQTIYLAFSGTPNVVDLTNTMYGVDCYAACFRNDLASISPRGARSLSGAVNIFLGRHFFTGKTSYEKSSDSTIGTLIHEFAHGAINAVDAPRVMANGDWELQPDHLADPTHADHGASPNNSLQSSTIELDKRLANKNPVIAVRNADSYGQFATAIQMAYEKAKLAVEHYV